MELLRLKYASKNDNGVFPAKTYGASPVKVCPFRGRGYSLLKSASKGDEGDVNYVAFLEKKNTKRC